MASFPNSYAEPAAGPNGQMGFNAVVNGQNVGWYPTQPEAEGFVNTYSTWLAQNNGNPNAAAQDPSQMYFGEGDYQQYLNDQLALEWAKYEYEKTYLNTYLIPQMQMLDKRERARLALDATTQYAQLFGFGLPQNFMAIMKYGMGGEMDASAMGDLIPASANLSDEDMANIKMQLESAGWQGGTDDEAVDAWLKVAGNDPNQQEFAQMVQQSLLPEGAKPTIPGAAQMAQPFGQADVLKMLGSSEAELGSAPGYKYQGQPTLAMKAIQGQPESIAQSLMLQGMNPQQTAGFLSGTPFVKELTQGQALTSGEKSPFGFIRGRGVSAQQVGQWSPSKMGLVTGLAGFSGQKAGDFWSESMRFGPKGRALGPTRIA